MKWTDWSSVANDRPSSLTREIISSSPRIMYVSSLSK